MFLILGMCLGLYGFITGADAVLIAGVILCLAFAVEEVAMKIDRVMHKYIEVYKKDISSRM